MRDSNSLSYGLCCGSIRCSLGEDVEARYTPSGIDAKRVVNGSTAECGESLTREGWQVVDNVG